MSANPADELPIGKLVKLIVDLEGYMDGRLITFEIWRAIAGKEELILKTNGVSKNGKGIGFFDSGQVHVADNEDKYYFMAKLDDKQIKSTMFSFKKPASNNQGHETQDNAPITQSEKRISDIVRNLYGVNYGDYSESTMDVIKEKMHKCTEDETIIKNEINRIGKIGLVCNTFVQAVMHLSGYADFPLGGDHGWKQAYVDWAKNNNALLWPEKGSTEYPNPRAGDVLIFRRNEVTECYHVCFTVPAINGKFSLGGARSKGKQSGSFEYFLTFSDYDEKIVTGTFPLGANLADLIGQRELVCIIRPPVR